MNINSLWIGQSDIYRLYMEAMAKLVEMKNIGITVTSLSEISARISAVSDNDYKEYCANILKFQPVLLKGENVCL